MLPGLASFHARTRKLTVLWSHTHACTRKRKPEEDRTAGPSDPDASPLKNDGNGKSDHQPHRASKANRP
jgi:hypothetical protein